MLIFAVLAQVNDALSSEFGRRRCCRQKVQSFFSSGQGEGGVAVEDRGVCQ